MEPVSLSQLQSALRGTLDERANSELLVQRLCIDSREVRAGDLFWCLQGERHDSHTFAADAIRRGAAACVSQREIPGVSATQTLLVDDTRIALGDFARWYRHQHEALVIGVTGSVGKTTTREMIYAALSSTHCGKQSSANFNNEIGLPLSLLQLESHDEFGVFEMGACRVGDIRNLCEVACPEVGVIPRVGLAHLESFGSPENILLGKGELFDSLPAHGFAVLGGDDERTRSLSTRASCNTILVGERQGNQLRATDVRALPGKLQFTVERKKFEIPATGRGYLTAALCAIAVGREIGIQFNDISAGLRNFTGQPQRCRDQAIGQIVVIDDTYNSNPTSLSSACSTLAAYPTTGNRILVTGDMLELGAAADDLHAGIGAEVAAAGIDHLLAFGQHSQAVCRGAIAAGLPIHHLATCNDLQTLHTILDCWMQPGSVLLVKGSRGMQMERVIDWLQGHPLAVGQAISGVTANGVSTTENSTTENTIVRPDRRAVA